MMLQTRRSASRVDVCDFNALLLREHDRNTMTTKYFLTKSPPPMTYRDLRSAMTNRLPSNIVILPETYPTPDLTLLPRRRKSVHRKKHHRSGVDVYQSLIRSNSRCSMLSDRDASNDEMILLTNAFAIDIPSWSSNRSINLSHMPPIPKARMNNNSARVSTGRTTNYSPSLSLDMKTVKHMPPIPPHAEHRTTPIDMQTQIHDDQLTTTKKICEMSTRKQLHVYIPQLLSS